MAMNFFKRGIFKKNKGFSDKEIDEFVDYLKTNNMTFNEESPEVSESSNSQPETNLNSENDIKQQILEYIGISLNSPIKLLWNIYNDNSENALFEPLEDIIDSVIETNLKINERNESETDEYIFIDDNQKDLKSYIDRIQTLSVKYIIELMREYVDGDITKYLSNIQIDDFETSLKEYSNYNSFDDFVYAINKSKKIAVGKEMDAKIIHGVSKDKIHAWIFVIPPYNGGKNITDEMINEQLKKNNIIFNVDQDLINNICKNKQYFKIFEIAKGIEVVHGKDGYVEDHFSRMNTIDIKEDAYGNLNYKELNIVKNIHANDVICDIFYAVDGVDGKRVDGKVISAKKGKNPKIPKGRNTSLSEDEKQLLADKDGEILFKENVFNVNELLTIDHDVDNASGNINFAGDVFIKGDVREGFTVKAEGNVTIMGTVEGATVISAGDVIIKRGMTGGGKGVIKAEGMLKCIYLENCSAYAKGNIEVDQVMYSEVSSDNTITISGKKGSVTGGKIIAGKGITANVIGTANNSCLKTEVVLGCTPNMLKKKVDTEKALKNIEEQIFKINQNINYIESNIDKVTEERKEMLSQMKIRIKFISLQKENLSKTLEKLTNEIEENTRNSSMKCKEMNPIIDIKIGESSYTLNRQLNLCHIYRKNDVSVLNSESLVENIIF